MWYHMTDSRVPNWSTALVMTADSFCVMARNDGGVVREIRTNRLIQPVRIWL
jgi:hypothetical protein